MPSDTSHKYDPSSYVYVINLLRLLDSLINEGKCRKNMLIGLHLNNMDISRFCNRMRLLKVEDGVRRQCQD